MSSMSQREVTNKLIKEVAILMLSLDERDPAFGNKAAWNFIATELIKEYNHKAVLYYLKGKTRPLVCLGTESIRIGSNGAKKLLSLLRNNKDSINFLFNPWNLKDCLYKTRCKEKSLRQHKSPYKPNKLLKVHF